MLCMTTFSEHETAFINAMTFHIERDWKGRKSIFADNAGISGGYVSQIIGRKKCPQLDKQEKIAKALGYKTIYEFVDFGKTLTSADLMGVIPKFQMTGQATPPSPAPISFQDESDKKHQIVIEGFKDKERAIKLNQMLVEIEKRAPEKLLKIEGYLEGILENLPDIEDSSKKGQSTGTNGVN